MHSVFIDGEWVEATHENPDVSIVFPEDYGWEDDEDARPDPASPDAWCNSAGIDVRDNEVQVWISTGDPRGAFCMTIRKLDTGEMIMHLPYPGEGLPHEETEEIRPGTLIISRTKIEEPA